MPKLPAPATSNAVKFNQYPIQQPQRRQSLLVLCVLCTTSVILYILRSYQPDLASGIYRIKRIMEVKKEDLSSVFNKTRKELTAESETAVSNNKRPAMGKIAILANFVSKDPNAVYDPRFGSHLMNKACYADLWGYDFIYNVSWGFTDEIRGRNASSSDDNHLCFLDWGQWHRVPHLIALTENKEYEWILWADNEYVFWDLTQPLESLFQEMETNNLHNVHVVVPDDGHPPGTKDEAVFSTFSVLIRNSHFGRTLLQNWMAFAKGLCPNGNYDDINGCNRQYQWRFSDQPGLWYALGKTYSDLVEGSGEFAVSCNNQTGYLIVDGKWSGAFHFSNQMSEYFTKEGLIKSPDYSQIPHDQPILWSSYEKNTRSGIGINNQYIKGSDEDYKGIFAVHIKKQLRGKLQHSQLESCGRPVAEGGRGCHVGTNEQGVFDLSCGNRSYIAWDPIHLVSATSLG